MVKNWNEKHPGETGTKSTLIRSELLPESPGKAVESLSLQVFRIIISSNESRIKAEKMLPSVWGFYSAGCFFILFSLILPRTKLIGWAYEPLERAFFTIHGKTKAKRIFLVQLPLSNIYWWKFKHSLQQHKVHCYPGAAQTLIRVTFYKQN